MAASNGLKLASKPAGEVVTPARGRTINTSLGLVLTFLGDADSAIGIVPDIFSPF
jgi:hypothetical protein